MDTACKGLTLTGFGGDLEAYLLTWPSQQAPPLPHHQQLGHQTRPEQRQSHTALLRFIFEVKQPRHGLRYWLGRVKLNNLSLEV